MGSSRRAHLPELVPLRGAREGKIQNTSAQDGSSKFTCPTIFRDPTDAPAGGEVEGDDLSFEGRRGGDVILGGVLQQRPEKFLERHDMPAGVRLQYSRLLPLSFVCCCFSRFGSAALQSLHFFSRCHDKLTAAVVLNSAPSLSLVRKGVRSSDCHQQGSLPQAAPESWSPAQPATRHRAP